MIKKRIISAFVFVVFVLSIFAFDLLRVKESSANELGLSLPNQIVELSKVGTELKLSGINVNPENLLDVSFYFSGESSVKEKDAKKLVEYFLTAMTFEGERLWVNLSPYEKDRVLDEELAQTQLGKVLLKQDYLLKQLSSSLTNPETELGKEYWANRENRESQIENFNKIWISADKALVGEDGDLAMIEKSSMNVFTESDYLAMQKNTVAENSSSQFIKEKILPLIKDDVNKGSNFSELRQVYSALILAKWFKDKYFNSIYSHYIDSSKVKGVDTSDPAIKQKVFELYSKSFKEGVYNQIKKVKADNGSVAKKSYVSGGITPSPDSKVETKQLNRQNFDGQTMASGVAIFEPLMRSGAVIKMIAMSAMLLIAPAIGRFSQIYAQDTETSIASTSQRQSRAAVYQTDNLDSLLEVASNISLAEADRLVAMNRMSVDGDLNYHYYSELYSIFNNNSETLNVRKTALMVIAQMKDVRAFDGFKVFIDSHSIAETASLNATELKLLDESLILFAEWSDLMTYNSYFSDRLVVINTILPYADSNLNSVETLRYGAWYALAYLLNNEDTALISQLEELRAREVAANESQAQYAIDESNARVPVTVERNYLFRYPDSVADWSVDSVHSELIRISQNDDTILYQLPYIIESVNHLGDGAYETFNFGDGNQKDSLSYQVLDSLDNNRDLRSAMSASEETDLQTAIDSAKAKIWDRLNPISVITNPNIVAPQQFNQRFVRRVHLNQATRLDFPAEVIVYNVRGQIVGRVQAPRGLFQLNRANLNLGNGHYLIKVNYDFTTGQRSSNELPASDNRGTLPAQQENVLASRRYDYAEELEDDPNQDNNEGGLLVADPEYTQPEQGVEAIVQNFFAKLNKAQESNDISQIASVSMSNAVKVVNNLDEAGDMTPIAYVQHGGIDMDLDVEVQSSAIKDKLYSTMTEHQIQEHKAQSRFLAGFTFEFNMNKGKVTIDDIIAQKK